MPENRPPNALIHETSPYLLQHAHNPVQWQPWSETALRRARDEHKPILLSIGYSACHWCHVMERESFENETTAALMNKYFINIKVDREERPDLDSIYMTAVQMLTGSGGWPMTVFLTPEGVPFYGGTYYPPEDRHGLPGFPRVLLSVAHAYRDKTDLIRRDSTAIVDEIRKSDSFGGETGALTVDILDRAASSLLAGYDSQAGGFGRAPKFPPSMSLTFLLRSHLRTRAPRPMEAVEHTLRKMAHGGLFDQIGGGFHRYSVDARWLVPHFEKMLYDNALLSRIYLDAWLQTQNSFYRRIAQETLDYVRREMSSPEGGFYSSQDADSEGHEGKFFVWTPEEVIAVLGREQGEIFCRYFDITPAGNFEGKSIPNVPRTSEAAARFTGISEADLLRIIENGRKRLFEVREKRIKPARDEKVLTAWNGLMMRSFAEAALATGRDDYRETAVRNAEFLVSNLECDGRLLRSWKNGQARFGAYLEDYACIIDGLISVYEATFDVRWIRKAEQFAAVLLDEFWDPEKGNFFFTSRNHESLIHRPRDFYDNATPSGNSVAAGAFLRLTALTRNTMLAETARSILAGMTDAMASHTNGFSHLASALDFLLSEPREIAIIGDPADAETRVLLREVFGRYRPNEVVACGEKGGPALLDGRSRIDGRPTAYVCRNFTCARPVTNAEDLRRQLAL